MQEQLQADLSTEERLRNFVRVMFEHLESNHAYLKQLQLNLVDGWKRTRRFWWTLRSRTETGGDTCEPTAVEAAVERCETELGLITRLTNAAAIMPLGLLMEQSREVMQKSVSVVTAWISTNRTPSTPASSYISSAGQFRSLRPGWPYSLSRSHQATSACSGSCV